MTSQCTEFGLWQQLDFTCLFDPLAVNLKQGTKIFGGETFEKMNEMHILQFYSIEDSAISIVYRFYDMSAYHQTFSNHVISFE